MYRKHVLQLVDFSLSGYAAHYAVMKMHESEPLDVVLLVVGIRGRFPAPESVRSFAELMADAHRVHGGTARVCFSTGHPDYAVREMLRREQFSLVVTGSELAACLSGNDRVEWLIVEPAGGSQVPPGNGKEGLATSWSRRSQVSEIGAA